MKLGQAEAARTARGTDGVTSPSSSPTTVTRLAVSARCPVCRTTLDEWRCRRCGVAYDLCDGVRDLRPRAPFQVDVTFEVGRPNIDEATIAIETLEGSGAREDHPHLWGELVARIPKPALNPNALDLGCGPALHRDLLLEAGYDYVGVDFENAAADFLADAHALPFADSEFGLVMSMAVFEHLWNPHLAAREVARVLIPGGKCFGSVAFLEPFHSNSHLHHTHLGIATVLDQAGLELEWIAASNRWTVLDAAARNSLFPRLPKRAARALVAPVKLAHRAWWGAAIRVRPGTTHATRAKLTAGAYYFVAFNRGS